MSHCWGAEDTQPYKTQQRTSFDHQNAIPWMFLSQTFKDAITLTQRLGMRYIWIDSICIIQDDHNDWNIEFSKMREVYANDYLVVAADAGVDGKRGLFASRFGEEEALVPWTSNRNSSSLYG